MRDPLTLLFAMLIGLGLGLGSAWHAVSHDAGFGKVRAGVWSFNPARGTADADPYSRAGLVVRGEIPIGSGEGMMLTADQDESGAILSGRCEYTIDGPFPLSRLWTLSVHRPDGSAVPGLDRRHTLTSIDLVRNQAGSERIVLNQRARPGDWLPLPDEQPFVLVLVLYDTPLSAVGAAIDAGMLPVLRKTACP